MDMKKTLLSVLRSQENLIKNNLMGVAESKKVYVSWEELKKMLKKEMNENVPTDVKFEEKKDKNWYSTTGVDQVVGMGIRIISQLKNNEEFMSSHTSPKDMYGFLEKAVINIAEEDGIDLLPHINITMSAEEIKEKMDELESKMKN